MSNYIVTVNVSLTVGATPSQYQRTGAFISQGGTSTAPQTLTLLTQLSDLTPILTTAKAITSMTWLSSVVTVTTSVPHGYTAGDVVGMVISGVTPTGYNGNFQATITGTSTFTYPLASNPGTSTVQGFYLLEDEAELLAMATTFFAQGSTLSVYVLELGEGTAVEGVAALTTFETANPLTIYRYLAPRYWDGVGAFQTYMATFESPTSMKYFHVTSTLANYAGYSPLLKCAVLFVEAPTVVNPEFSSAADFWVMLNQNPSASNKVTPNAFAFVYGVTPYPLKGNGATLAALKAAYVNVIATGAEGGISNAIVKWGTSLDGRDLTYWYAVDWNQITIAQALANAVINGSNNPQNPLYYDQNGINTLQAVAQQQANAGVTFGLNLGPVTVTATSFAAYTAANPGDYKIGAYNGLAVTITPNRGFKSITFNMQVTDIPPQ